MAKEAKSRFGGLAGLACFVALGVSAIIAFITYLLPLISEDIAIGGSVMNTLELIFKISSLVGLGFGALGFASSRGKIVRFLTALFVLVFIVAIVLVILNII